MGFENTDKKTAQEVPLLFQSSALILLDVQVLLGRYQPQGLPTALGPRRPKPQHTWNSLPVSTGGGEGRGEWQQRGPRFFPYHTPTMSAPSPRTSGKAQPLLTYPWVESPDPRAGSKGHCLR